MCCRAMRWTRAFPVVNHENAVRPFLETNRLSKSDWAMLMGGACENTYRWAPKKGIDTRILAIRGHKVMIDADLAELYGVTTKRLNQQVRRNSASPGILCSS